MKGLSCVRWRFLFLPASLVSDVDGVSRLVDGFERCRSLLALSLLRLSPGLSLLVEAVGFCCCLLEVDGVWRLVDAIGGCRSVVGLGGLSLLVDGIGVCCFLAAFVVLSATLVDGDGLCRLVDGMLWRLSEDRTEVDCWCSLTDES